MSTLAKNTEGHIITPRNTPRDIPRNTNKQTSITNVNIRSSSTPPCHPHTDYDAENVAAYSRPHEPNPGSKVAEGLRVPYNSDYNSAPFPTRPYEDDTLLPQISLNGVLHGSKGRGGTQAQDIEEIRHPRGRNPYEEASTSAQFASAGLGIADYIRMRRAKEMAAEEEKKRREAEEQRLREWEAQLRREAEEQLKRQEEERLRKAGSAGLGIADYIRMRRAKEMAAEEEKKRREAEEQRI